MATNVPFNLIHTGNNATDDVNLVFQSSGADKFNIGYDTGDDLFTIARGNSLDTGKIVTINSPDNYTGDIVLKVETSGISGSINNLVTITSNQNNSTPIFKLSNTNNGISADTAMIFENGNNKFISMGYKNTATNNDDSFLITNNTNLNLNEILKINTFDNNVTIYGNKLKYETTGTSNFNLSYNNNNFLTAKSNGSLESLGFTNNVSPPSGTFLKYNGTNIEWSDVDTENTISIENSSATNGITTLISPTQLESQNYLKYFYLETGDTNNRGSNLILTSDSTIDYNRIFKIEGFNYQHNGSYVPKRANYIMGIKLHDDSFTNICNLNATEIEIDTTFLLKIGMGVSGTGIPSGSTITDIIDDTKFTISGNYTQSQNVNVLFSTANEFTDTCDLVSNSDTVTMSNTDLLSVGMSVVGAGVPNGSNIIEIISTTQFKLSNLAFQTGNSVSLTFSSGDLGKFHIGSNQTLQITVEGQQNGTSATETINSNYNVGTNTITLNDTTNIGNISNGFGVKGDGIPIGAKVSSISSPNIVIDKVILETKQNQEVTFSQLIDLHINNLFHDIPNGTIFNLFDPTLSVSNNSSIKFTLFEAGKVSNNNSVNSIKNSLKGDLQNTNTNDLDGYVGLSSYDLFDKNFKSGLSIDHTGAFQIAGIDLSEGNISNAGNINCDTITVDEVSNGLTINFAGNSTKNKIILKDNLADALNIIEGTNSYMKFVTTNSSESVIIGNSTNNPTLSQLGSGQVTFAGNVDANSGLSVAGNPLTIDNQAITQTNGGQVTFAGNVDANSGLDVAGNPLTIDNQAITQTNGGQVTFAGNVDANSGLDVAGNPLTIDNQAITQTNGGQVTFAGNVDANSGLDVAGNPLTINNQAITQTNGGQVIFAGNVDANSGLDVAGNPLTIDNQAITQTNGGQVTFAGNVDANSGLDVAGNPLTIDNQAITQTNGGQDNNICR